MTQDSQTLARSVKERNWFKISRRKFLPVIVLLAFSLLIGLFFNKLVFSKLILARGDVFLYFDPYWQAAADALREGRLPLWNPNIFMGAPLAANSQVGIFYPLNWPLWLLLPTPYAVSATIVIHLFIASVGTYLAGRRCLSLSMAGSLLAAVLFALGTSSWAHPDSFHLDYCRCNLGNSKLCVSR
jgi:hypothetical protein